MRLRPTSWFLLSLMFFLAAMVVWNWSDEWQAKRTNSTPPTQPSDNAKPPETIPPNNAIPAQPPRMPLLSTASAATAKSAASPKARHPYRLTNTAKDIDQLAHDGKSVLLRNALIDTETATALPIPARLRSQGDPGSYVVQSRGPLDDAFRARLRDTGAEIISYIPNDAYLVRVPAAGAQQLADHPQTQTVLPFEPYYKLDEKLLKLAVEQKPLPPEARLNLVLFPGERANAANALARLGAQILGEDRSPFGPILVVRAPADALEALASLPAVQGIEVHHERMLANDLARVRVGVSPDTTSATNNYLGLTGSGILVNVNDSGVDARHPDLTGRVFGDAASTLLDPFGHGTHVAGTIISSGEHSPPGAAASGSVSNANFHGMAPQASVFALPIDNFFGPSQTDTYLQERAAQTNAFISNNSWNYAGASVYDIAASSYDAAVRDALPGVTGSQPLLLVFSAGNAGFGNPGGLSGEPDSIESPATAKNVITVGSIEQLRNITNEVVVTNFFATEITNSVSTNHPFLDDTDPEDEDQVARFSSRGNVGIGLEGSGGRFKPDVVAPGTFLVSTRPAQWDTAAYYNPTNNTVNTFVGQVVQPGLLNNYNIFVPDNAVQLRIFLRPNPDSLVPFPDLPIYVKQGDFPTTNDLLNINSVSLPPDAPLTPKDTTWFYSIGNPMTVPVNFDLVTVLVTLNDSGNYFQVLSNLNETLGPYYRYESGTSMSAAAASGTLALMQQFFEQRLQRTYSPALMKALLINGARDAGTLYDFQIDNFINLQGWGLIKLQNSLPGALTNFPAQSSSIHFFDQSPAEALATGQSKTRRFTVAPAAQNEPLRVTLVWTDPPGNPAASIKLVNDLDLIVTNLDTGEIFHGNDIPAGFDVNQPAATNGVPFRDAVNNVENVYLPPTLGSNYTVTVAARRVNVNAVTAQTNNVKQDYALVLSIADGQFADAISLQGQPTAAFDSTVSVTTVTNNGIPLLNQRVGANSALLGTTNGVTNQWNFYVFTNNTFTNVAFITFLPPDLALPRIGTRESDLDNATRIEADIDMYVSTDSSLTNLDPAAVAGAFKSRTRGGTENIVFTNALPNQIYYVGVKSEDQRGAEYGFLGVSSELPFSERDEFGNLIVRGIPVPTIIPDGTPAKPGGGLVFGIAAEPVKIRRAVVTNTILHEKLGDLLGNLSHGNNFVVLNNHRASPFLGSGPFTYVYDDSQEGSLTSTTISDGPGSLRSFVGEEGLGVWLLTMVDNSLDHTGRVDGLTIRLEPQSDDTNGILAVIEGLRFFYDFIDVPPEATNLTVSVSVISGGTPVELYLRRGDFPTRTVFDKFAVINGGGSLSIDLSDSPPLNAGRYYIGVFNPSLTPVTVRIVKTLGLAAAPADEQIFTSAQGQPILDDAVTVATRTVTNDQRIVSAQVGVRIDHPRVSDLALTLISPRGTRVLLAENRGGATTEGYGTSTYTTNVQPTTTSGDAAANTNTIVTGQNQATVKIDYDFETIPDSMHIYYDGIQIYDTGLINGAGSFTVNYGPGVSTDVIIIVNEGNNADTNTLWSYTATVVTGTDCYLTFTEDAKKTTTPIKFAPPPFACSQGITNTPPPGAGWVQWDVAAGGNGHWYKAVLETNSLSWTQADQIAASAGGYLATITSAAENDFVFALINSPQFFRDWFGFGAGPALGGIQTVGAVEPAGGWAWVTGEPWGYTNWLPGQPDNDPGAGNEDRLYYFSATPGVPGNTWDDFPADLSISSGAYVMEHEPLFASGGNYFLPETSLDRLIGENAQGDWKLEILDDRAGATLNGPLLVSWILDLVFENTAPIAIPLTHAQPVTNTVAPNSSKCFFVDVPIWARFATNTLTHTNGSLDLLFNQNGLPTGTNAGDITLMTSVPPGNSVTLDTNGVPPLPPLMPGQRYFLCVRNPDPMTPVTFTIQVDFDITTLTNAVPLTSDIAPAPIPRYFQFDVSTNAAAALFELFDLSGNVELVVHRGPPLPDLAGFDYGSFNPGTNNEAIVVFTNSFPVGLTPGRWYLGVFNVDTNNVTYTIRATEFTNAEPVIIGYQVISNALCLTWNSIPTVSYHVQGKINLNDPFWNAVSPTIVATGTETTYCIPLPTPYQFFQVVQGLAPVIPDPNVANVVPGNSIRYFYVDVPTWANFATNAILTATGPVNLLFTQNGLPAGNADTNEFTLLSNVTSGSFTLATNGIPPLLPGQRYFLGVQNTNLAPVTFRIQVEFDITTLLNGVPIASDLPFGPIPRYFQFDVSTNAVGVAFQVFNSSGNVDLVVRQNPPLPNLTLFDYGSFNLGTNNEAIGVTTNSTPVSLTPGLWYLSVFNVDATNVTYTIRATELTNTEPVIVNFAATSNSFCITWRSVPGVNYLVQGKKNLNDTNWITMSPTIPAADFETTYCVPLPSPYHFFRVVEGSLPANPEPVILTYNMTSNAFCITWQSVPTFTYLVQGKTRLNDPTWTTVSPTITAVDVETTHCVSLPTPYQFFRVVEGSLPVNPEPVILGYSVASNAFCITWQSVPSFTYLVQGKPNLNDPTWTAVSPTITAVDVETTHCVPLPSPYQFFRVVEGSLPPAVNFSGITMTTNGVVLQWNAPTSQQFQVEWKPALTAPTWNTFTNIVSSATGNFTFIDDGSQTGGLGATRFYRLLPYP